MPSETPLNQAREKARTDGCAESAVLAGIKQGVLIALVVVGIGLPAVHLYRTQGSPTLHSNQGARTVAAPERRSPHYADFGRQAASADARFIANWVADSGDNRHLSFVIIDKKNAMVFVFDPDGRLKGATPVLLGAAPGDDSVAGIGKRPISQVRPEERTTPAGRFMGEPGRNTAGEDVVWVDYDAAVSMHRVRLVDPKERRLERLASPTADDNRISYGCVNVPVAFFENVLSPVFQARYGVVYVLPEVKPLLEVFANAYDPATRHPDMPGRLALR